MARTPCEEYTKKYKQRKNQNCDKLDVRPVHPLNPIVTKFGMWGGLPDVFLKFEYQDDRSINVGAVGGRNLPFPIKPIFKMAAAAILNLVPSLFLAHRRIWIVFLYVRVIFRKSNSTGG